MVDALAAIPLETSTGKRDYALIVVGLYIGRRLSELAGMSREHITVRKSAIEIFWPRCKGGRTVRDTIARRGQKTLPAQALLSWLATQESIEASENTTLPVSYQGEHPIWINLARNGTIGHLTAIYGLKAHIIPDDSLVE